AKEMQSVLQHTSLTQEQVLQMATSKGAAALQWDDALGSFEKGKKPGIVMVKDDFNSSRRII
ncbi:MAG TPA: amidohydrolase family protein, partial [Lacibacter sp.]|nr:amidohydrolase family protein [Lacibacter sp.]